LIVLYASTDLFFSLMPLPFVMSFCRPLSERIVIPILMALGLFATIVSMVKLRFLDYWNDATYDPTWDSADFYLWAGVESAIALTAASAPQLKRLFQKTLSRLLSPAPTLMTENGDELQLCIAATSMSESNQKIVGRPDSGSGG
jgi:hypothetical protein